MGDGLMSMPAPFASADHFDALHRDSADPWGVHARWYERRKRDLLLAALPRARYGQIYEPGCSVGGNTLALAVRCDRLVASDASRAAIDRAASALAGFDNVELLHGRFPALWPTTPSDLVVVAELAYYLPNEDFQRFLATVADHLQPGGQLLMCHWRGRIGDAATSGDAVHTEARQVVPLAHVGGWQDEDMRIDVWQRGGQTSVATTGGAQERLAPAVESAP